MDHVDWLDLDTANTVAKTLAEQVIPGGIVIWRSAAMVPPYAALIAKAGFDVKCIQRSDEGYMDRCAKCGGGGGARLAERERGWTGGAAEVPQEESRGIERGKERRGRVWRAAACFP
jgi:hypothetical protein